MKSIKELAPKPSDALQAMVDGLRQQSKRRNFEIDMSTFGEKTSNGKQRPVCCGCAATCTIQKLARKNFIPSNNLIESSDERANYLGFDQKEMDRFELAIDQARRGHLDSLFSFYNLSAPPCFSDADFLLRTYDWQEQLPIVEDLIKELRARNF